MAEFTLLKLEVDDASFSASAPFSGGSSGDSGESRTDEGSDERRLLPLVAGLVFLVAVAVVVKRLRGSSEEELIETEAPAA